MWENFIGRQIRRANTRLLLANLITLAIVALIVFGNWRYLNNWFRGTVAITPAEVAALKSAKDLDRNFVKLDVGEIVPSGFQEVEQENGKTTSVKADYLVTWIAGRALVLKTKPNSTNTHLEGALVEMPIDVSAALRQDLPADKQYVLLPFMLDTVDYRDDGYWMLGIFIPIIALCVWNLMKWSQRSSNFAAHPIVQKMGGEAAVIQYGQQLDTEMSGGGEKFGAATLTANWVVVPFFFGAHLARLDDLAWVYKKVTKHSVNFVPTGKTYEAVLWSRAGVMTSVTGKEAQVDKLLATIANRTPWVVGGFSAELDAAWKKDRAGFVAAVDQRRTNARTAGAHA